MRCTHDGSISRCPKPARYANDAGERVCHEHALERVRAGGLMTLRPPDRARFLAESAGYAGGRIDDRR